MAFRKYGDFDSVNSDFHIHERDIPRNWYNYFWNDNYITFCSQTCAGEGFLQDKLGKRIELVKERGFFVAEAGESWGIGGLPVEQVLDRFHCTHALGETVIESEKNGIASTLCVIVPTDAAGEAWRVSLENRSERPRTLSVFGFCGTGMDKPYTRQGYNTGTASFDRARNAVVIGTQSLFDGARREIYGFLTLSQKADGYDCTANAIIGPYGSFAHPVIAGRASCTNTAGCGEKLAMALQKDLTLLPGQKTELVFYCGVAFSPEELDAARQRFACVEGFEAARVCVKKACLAATDGVEINTPDAPLNKMFTWLKHQTIMGSRWARVRHNGFRDMTSDTECLAAFSPALALERFRRILTYQYANGYAPRTFIDGAVADKNFSDNTVWLTFTAMAILKELGDISILDEVVPYNDGTAGTIYEHLFRSVDFLYHFRGLHGLIRIWGGDWNDCMNLAGLGGVGVSVWLSIAWYRANAFLAEIAELYGKSEDAALCRARGEELRGIIEEHGWDGAYYIDAYNDAGTPIGSQVCKEGRIFLIPQIWAVLSGVSTNGREIRAMDAVEQQLSSPLGTKISYPPYTHYDAGIGSVTLKPAGVHENGGVYLHTIAWKIAADAMLKRADKVAEDIKTILPFRNPVVNGRAEPYIMCNSYFGEETGYRYGTPGQSWRTAAGQWFQKALVNYVFGLMPQMEGLCVDPCLPPEWKTCSIRKTFRGTTYNIRYVNNGTTVKEITVDGRPIAGNVLPLTGGEVAVVVYCE